MHKVRKFSRLKFSKNKFRHAHTGAPGVKNVRFLAKNGGHDISANSTPIDLKFSILSMDWRELFSNVFCWDIKILVILALSVLNAILNISRKKHFKKISGQFVDNIEGNLCLKLQVNRSWIVRDILSTVYIRSVVPGDNPTAHFILSFTNM